MRTRSSAPAPVETAEASKPIPSISQQRPKVLILPTGASDDARFLRLENPRTNTENRYYFCPKLGLFEFTSIAPPPSTPRSILFVGPPIEPNDNDAYEGIEKEADNIKDETPTPRLPDKTGLISSHAEFIVATPIDVLFFVLPILAPPSISKTSRRLFQPLDDILDAREDISKGVRNTLLDKDFRATVERRMNVVCDTVEAGETMFRLNEQKLVMELLSKAETTASNGLPPTMEERFVQKALEMPMMSIKREETAVRMTSVTIENDEIESQDVTMSQVSTKTTTTEVIPSTSISTTSTPLTEPSQLSVQDEKSSNDMDLAQLLRVRTVLQFIQSSYLPPHLSTKVDEILASPSSPKDFTFLTKHMKYLAKLRAEVAASRSMYDNTSRKRLMDDEEIEAAAERKRNQEEEERRKKAKVSRGVKDLKKVDTSSMKKLSSFFGKKS